MESSLDLIATLASPELEELPPGEEEHLSLIAEELREAIRRKIAASD